uniref:NADH:ubiquinone reductase (H(+)-translocating) n=1 Tax=Saccostrea mytiloides TaxID=413180 RepID=A0A2H4F1Y3_9BIVA|nr:NADH dehydrogenase subunit 5 [Saccostrea mytiloides]ANY59977.1 NADH dehydrogenase subunit 5 [Saccostrea mytiloides]
MVLLNSWVLMVFSAFFSLLAAVMANCSLSFWFCWELGHVSMVSVSLDLCLDWIAALFMSVIMMISGCVGFFMSVYMGSEDTEKQFNLTLYSFVSSMLVLVWASSMPVVLLGWDWLGVTSFLLVMYYEGKKSFDAAMITALTNRIGDALLICSTAGMCMASDLSWDMKPYCWSFIFIVGCITKSAQVPFSSWLPAAMMAPTPVSSLVHSSTLVTAGIYLLIRSSTFWLSSNAACSLLMGVGIITTTIAGVSAVMESDVKKVVALSTLSQLGIMAFSLGLGEVELAFMHLVCHAFFKAGMFLSVGSMISHNAGNQFFSSFGMSVASLSPSAVFGLFMGSISLMGIPGTAGYASKESIVASGYSSNSWFMGGLMYLGIGLTALYSVRVLVGVTSLAKHGIRDFLGARETLTLSAPGVFLVFMGLIGGEFVLLSSSGGFFFEVLSSSEAWFCPYLLVVGGVVAGTVLQLILTKFYELQPKWIYGMIFLDLSSRSLVSEKGSTSFSGVSSDGENVAEVSIPVSTLEVGLEYLSDFHNVIQRGSVTSGVGASLGLGTVYVVF